VKDDRESWIKKNKPSRAEFLEENNLIYTAIALKGEILKLLDNKDIALEYFEDLINTGKSQEEQIKELRKILNDLKSTTNRRTDPLMRFGLNTNSISGIYKKILIEILSIEVL
jgi:hypothetical protein